MLLAHREKAAANRKRYNDNILMTKQEQNLTSLLPVGSRPNISQCPTSLHISFDFAQDVLLPRRMRQVRSFARMKLLFETIIVCSSQVNRSFYSPLFRVKVFGIATETFGLQTNYILPEGSCLDEAKGPNSVISMVHYHLTNRSRGQRSLYVNTDNCASQNKNQYMMQYWSLCIIMRSHDYILHSFMNVGHTKCFCDSCFGLWKKRFLSSNTETVTQLKTLIDSSSRANEAFLIPMKGEETSSSSSSSSASRSSSACALPSVEMQSSRLSQTAGALTTEEPITWRDWKTFLGRYFTRVPKISSMNTFEFKRDSDGSFVSRMKCDGIVGEWIEFDLLKKGIREEDVLNGANELGKHTIEINRLTESRVKEIRKKLFPLMSSDAVCENFFV